MPFGFYRGFAPRLSVAERRAKAERTLRELRKKGQRPSPVLLDGRRTIAETLWGREWCDHLESYSDYENRLPRGRSYVRHNGVVDLTIKKGLVTAKVQGSDLYEVKVKVKPINKERWSALVARCAGQIGSLVDLLEGKLSPAVMEQVADRERGIFPEPKEITLSCSCPDWARLCKHVCAALYGIGARFDREPELLFRLRGADPSELIGAAVEGDLGATEASADALSDDLASLFGIEIEMEPTEEPLPPPKPVTKPLSRRKRAVDKLLERREAAERLNELFEKKAEKPEKPEKKQKKQKKKKPEKQKKKQPAQTRKRKISRKELLELGIPPSTIASWIRSGVLLSAEERGRYRLTATARERMLAYS